MTSPWEVLGLDPATADRDDVRRAYVRLVKVHRPDRDPDRFQEVRRAYELALEILDYRDRTGTPIERIHGIEIDGTWTVGERWEPDDDSDDADEEEREFGFDVDPPSPSPDETDRVSIDLSPDLAYEVSPAADDVRFEQLVAAEGRGDTADVQAILEAARADWHRDPLAHAGFPDLVVRAPVPYLDTVGDAAAATDCLLDVRQGGTQLLPAVVDRWVARGAWAALEGLADDLLAHRNAPSDPDAEVALPFALGICARALALKDSVRARRLADEAHQGLPPEIRDAFLHEVDIALRMDEELRDLSAPDREVLARVLHAGDDEMDGAGELAILNAVTSVPRGSVTIAVLRDRLPNSTGSACRVRRVAKRAARRTESTGSWTAGLPYLYPLVLLVIVIGALSRHCNRSAQLPSPMASTERMNRRMERLDESLRLLREIRDGVGLREPWENLPRDYDELKWLQPVRRLVGIAVRHDDTEAWRAIIEGRDEIRSDDPRCPIMLQALSEDDTLPPHVREACWRQLGRR